MKAILEFDLPEEQEYFETTMAALETASEINCLDMQLRSWIKHGGHQFETPESVMEWVRTNLPNLQF